MVNSILGFSGPVAAAFNPSNTRVAVGEPAMDIRPGLAVLYLHDANSFFGKKGVDGLVIAAAHQVLFFSSQIDAINIKKFFFDVPS